MYENNTDTRARSHTRAHVRTERVTDADVAAVYDHARARGVTFIYSEDGHVAAYAPRTVRGAGGWEPARSLRTC